MQTRTSAKRSSITVALGALLMLAMLLSPLLTPGSSLADRITVSVRLDGGSAWTPPSPSSNGEVVSGPTGVTIQVEFTLRVTDGTPWRGTSYQFEGGQTVCVNHTDATANGTYTRTFNIVAPANAGEYDLTLTARSSDDCSSGTSAAFKMLNAVTVAENPNPDLTAACGIRVVLVLDESGSIEEEGAIGSVRQAANAFIESLADTGSEVAVVEFNTHARTPIPFTPVTAGPTGTIATIFRPYVNDTSGGEGYNPGDYPYGNGLRTTNWDDAFEKVQTLNQGSNRAPLVVFVTDGDPTSYNLDKPGDPLQLNPAGLPGIGGNGLTTDWPTLGRAVEGVNLVRAAGTHVLGVGVGNAFTSAASENRLKLITGPQKYTGGTLDLKTTDYVLVTNFTNLKTALRTIAVELCGNSLTITKKLDADGDGIFEPAPGWPFTGSVYFPAPNGTAYTWVSPNPAAIPGNPVTASTDENGTITFQWAPQAAGNSLISVQETLPTGYQFVGLDCMYTTPDNATPQILSVTREGNGLLATMGSLWIGTCEFRNLAEPTPTPTPTSTATPTSTPTSTATPTSTPTSTSTPSPTPTPTSTPTSTPSPTPTPTSTPTSTPSPTPTLTSTPTSTPSPTPTPTSTPTSTPSPTPTLTSTATETPASGCIEGSKIDVLHVGLPGWTIYARPRDMQNPVLTAVTNGSGAFRFNGLTVGWWTVWEEMQAGWAPVTLASFDVQVSAGPGCAEVRFKNRQACSQDPYEPDDTPATAALILPNGLPQKHTLEPPTEADWVRFSAVAGARYSLRTDNLLGGADTTLTLFDTDGVTPLAQNDDITPGTDDRSQIIWQAPATGTYYARVTDFYQDNARSCLGYDLILTATYKVYLPLIIHQPPPPTPTPTPTATSTPTSTLTPTSTPTPTVTSIPTPIPPIVIEGLKHPKGIGINLANHRLYVASRDTDVVYEVNPLVGTVVRSIPVGDEPFGVAVNTTTNKIYVANYLSNTVSVIDGATGNVSLTIPLTPYTQPSYVAINEVTNRIYVSLHGSGRLAVINGVTDTLATTLEVGAGAFGVAVDPVHDRIFVSCRDAKLVRVIKGATNEVLWDQTINPGGTPYALGIDPGLAQLYVSFAPVPDDPSQVLVYRIPEPGPSLTGSVIVGSGGPDGGGGVAANPITHHVFVTNAKDDTVSVFDGGSLLLLDTVPTGDDPMAVAVDPGLNYAFVGNRRSNNLTSIPDTY